MMDLETVAAFMLGAITGSFLNVCIVRLPTGKSVVFPSSHCVRCQKPIAWFDNIPLLSWLMLRGKCRYCGECISFRYWVVELITAAMFVVLYKHFGLTSVLLPYLIMMGGFIVATFVDFEHRIIPDEISIGGMAVGIIASALVPALHPVSFAQARLAAGIASALVLVCLLLTWIYPFFCKHLIEEEQDASADRGVKILVACSLLAAILINTFILRLPWALVPAALSLSAALSGYIIGGGVIYAMGLIGDIIFKKESMGGGDVKLMAMVGAFMGWEMAVLTFFLAPFFGAVYGIIEKIRTKDSTIAYGPFLVVAAVVSLFWGPAIIHWVLNGGIYGG